MEQVRKTAPGFLLCLLLAIPSWWLGHLFPVIGGPVFAIVLGMAVTLLVGSQAVFQPGVAFTSKKILQYAVILLGFGLNLSEIAKVGLLSLPIICSTITISLVIAFVLSKRLHMPNNISVLVGVGSSICGGTVLNYATIVKLTRTLAIIPITLALAFWRTWQVKRGGGLSNGSFELKKIFPFFILFFVLASIITTVATLCGVDAGFFAPLKELSKFFIILAMAAIGLNTNLIKLVKTGGKPILMGACCWLGITGVSLLMQHLEGLM